MSPRVKAALSEGLTALVNIKTLLGLIVGAALGLSAYVRIPERVTALEAGRVVDGARISAVETKQDALLRFARQSWCVDSTTAAGKNPRSCVQP